ncbi:transcriptional regulator [Martelella sp. HB161492]|uniref:transcriptional regulator n=1 Tax=Martelella sp. HB161492 TaxID=2720726 RepID=UPI0015918815|nr:transcriptional regulator [Martelella sp. HB161492]
MIAIPGYTRDGERMVFIITGKVYHEWNGDAEVHVLIAAPDEDSAVRNTLNALAAEGYAEADLDQIGLITEIPDEEPHASAYETALEGEVAIIKISGE